MCNHTSFYKEIDRRGGVLNPSTLPSHLQELARTALSTCIHIRDSINNSDILYPLGDTRIEIVNNTDMNAFAHHDDGQEGIAIYSGLFERLCKLSFALWSVEGLFSVPHDGSRAIEVLEKLMPTDEFREWRTLPLRKLSDEHRFQRSFNTALIGLTFIFMHEVGHLVKAHIPFLSQGASLKLKTLFERNNKIDAIGSNAKLQSLEIDADIHAIRAVIDLAMTTWKMGKIFPVNFPYYKGDEFAYLVDIYRGVLIAIYSLDPYSTDPALESNDSHPTPGVRCGVVFAAGNNLLGNPFKVQDNVAMGAFIAASMEVGDLFTKKKLNAVTLEHDLTILIKIAGEKLEQFKGLETELKPMKDNRIRLKGSDPTKFDQFSDFYNQT